MLILFYPIPIIIFLFVIFLLVGEVRYKTRNIINLSVIVLVLYLFVLIPFVFLSFKERTVKDFYICECAYFDGANCVQIERADPNMIKENDKVMGVCGTLEPVDEFQKILWGDRISFLVRLYYQSGKLELFPQDVIQSGSFFFSIPQFSEKDWARIELTSGKNLINEIKR